VTWIKTIPFSQAGASVQETLRDERTVYPKEYARDPTDEGSRSIVATHTLIPEALRHAFGTFGALLSPELPLSRAQHEMIATRVSALNRCQYCRDSHAEFLRSVTLDAGLVKALLEDYEHAPLASADRVMLDYVSQVTGDATRITPEHHAGLRAAGFDDRGILQITLIASWFNYINRVADALGVGKE
jgi:uncharacterized peroxidase-related enzyme